MTRFELSRFYKDRRRAQAGTTLIELLVSLVIIGFAVTLIVGTFSTGVINATLAKRNTASQAVVQYELDKIHASTFGTLPASYSECFATDNPGEPKVVGYQSSCPDPTFALRADVCLTTGSSNPATCTPPDPTQTRQLWMVTISSWPDQAQIGTSVQVYKVKR